MTFEEWWVKANCRERLTKPLCIELAYEAWEVATNAERERCAQIASKLAEAFAFSEMETQNEENRMKWSIMQTVAHQIAREIRTSSE